MSLYQTYQSPFSWRYSSKEMQQVFSEQHKYELWRKIWVALATAEHRAGLVTKDELNDLKDHQQEIDIERILELEKDLKHDVVAAIHEYAEKCPVGGGKIHFGATSMDIVDNAEMIRMHQAIEIVANKLKHLLRSFQFQLKQTRDIPCMAYTHLQPAEPTTVGYRLAFYVQDLLTDLDMITGVFKTIRGKGMKGAVGTRASYTTILETSKTSAEELDRQVMGTLGIESAEFSSQVYPRKYDYLVASALAGLASSCSKFAADLRILQSPLFGEWSEPFGKKQVGSSAMPFKRNPISSEKICSLARYVQQLPPVLLENASLSYLERTLDDSANRRIVIAELFLATDEILETMNTLVITMNFHQERIAFNLRQFAPFAATEPLLIALVKKGANRQEMHELLRQRSMKAWKQIQEGKENSLKEDILNDSVIKNYLSKQEINSFFTVTHHLGDAPKRVQRLLKKLQRIL